MTELERTCCHAAPDEGDDAARRVWRNRLFKLAMLFCMFVAFGTLVGSARGHGRDRLAGAERASS